MLGWLMRALQVDRPCKARLEAELHKKRQLQEEHTKLERQAAAIAYLTSRRLRNVSLKVILDSADDVAEDFRRREGR